MSDRKQVILLVDAAGRDLSALRGMGDADTFADEIFGFHLQQAAEKLFKAWLALLGEAYPTTHDLETLLALLRARDARASRFEELIEYTAFAVQFRYSGADPGAEPLDRGDGVRSVEQLWAQVRDLIDASYPATHARMAADDKRGLSSS